ncbi:MAG: type II secretion system F family protein [Planctomycetota bacterium]
METFFLFVIGSLLFWGALLGPRVLRRRRNLFALGEELASSIRLNIPLPKVLAAFSSDLPPVEAAAGQRVARRVEQGDSFAEAAKDEPRLFPGPAPLILAAGERAGNLEGALIETARWARRDYTNRGILVLVFWYPFILGALYSLFSAWWSAIILAKFLELFAHYEQYGYPMHSALAKGLVWETRILFGYVPIGLGLLAVGWKVAGGWIPTLQRIGRIRSWIPFLDRAERQASQERMCRILAFALRADLPLPEALRIAAEAGMDARTADTVRKAAGWVEEGDRLEEALSKSGRFPADFLWRAGRAERSREPGEAFRSLAERIESRRKHRLRVILWAAFIFAVIFIGLHLGAWEWILFDSFRIFREVYPS